MANPGSEGEHELQRRHGTRNRAQAFYEKQMLTYLNEDMRRYIQKQEMVFIATADSRGECDCSFRGGLPGFIHVLDENRLVFPEYRGNGVMASLGNILENPQIGMWFGDFFDTTIGLHVNGKATIVEKEEMEKWTDLPESLAHDLAVSGGRKSERWIRVRVEEAYIHCSKHIPKLKRLDKAIHWGTDDDVCKGGDFFRASVPLREMTKLE